MKYKNLIIEKKEFVLLKRYMNLSGYYKDVTLGKSVKKLLTELESAKICDEVDMPKDVIRFNSTITIRSENGWTRKFQLVMPNDSDVKRDKVSILTPMGAAVIGYAEGDTLIWEFPNGEQRLTIEKIEQENKYINVNMIL
ncbi:GreA/GreB family elongation factor [Arenibacter sp. S6351L]|jgi:regulator of nucleoside diphosphate kinase|uniref:GreA/GreB family elongation factor n=1 Tax=Arenibacter sp. S6351L TaxID=2926407 RepID=UPI001FF69EAF|nr:GreA/GreB family elongation factor [Arenibacter sp. S6351L]MCK0135527.1 GreA/GreB family elongation factor [Arenibacter sp. S6351L]MDX1766737.1 GreA/GreB family elongation factor [Arenibacter troitsensis]